MGRPSTRHLPCVKCGIHPKVLLSNGLIATGKCKQCTQEYNKTRQEKYNKKTTHCTKCGVLNLSKAKHCVKCSSVYTIRYQKKHPEKLRETFRKSSQRRRDELRDAYIRLQLAKDTPSFEYHMATPELISVKRAQLTLMREIRRQQNGQK